jgi:hypothetical protein
LRNRQGGAKFVNISAPDAAVLRKWLKKNRQVKKLKIEQFGAGSVHKTGRFNEENSDVSTTVAVLPTQAWTLNVPQTYPRDG